MRNCFSVQNPGGGWARDPGGDLLPPLLDQDPDYDPAHQAQLKKGRWSQVRVYKLAANQKANLF
jgi:hypothetical protein